jgi:hypothetical protein
LKCSIIIEKLEFMVNKNYEQSLLNSKGWIAELTDDSSPHYFGGNQWRLSNNVIFDKPCLLLSLNFADIIPNKTSPDAIGLVPICSYINSDIWINTQYYHFDPNLMEVNFIEKEIVATDTIFTNDFPNPLPQKYISLRSMDSVENLEDESTYWDACDEFVGGESLIRILGRPLWLQSSITSNCVNCTKQNTYICSIGYQNYLKYTPFIKNMPFFIGESALYFFLCVDCKIISVFSQST